MAVARGAGETISAVLSWARRVLIEAQVDSPHLDAELLLGHALGWCRTQFYASTDQLIHSEDRARYAKLIARRARREPLAYLVGHQEFYGLDFSVDRRVLIPRPETEVLVEQAIVQGIYILESTGRLAIAEVGTGCGAIAIALALHLPRAEVYAIDISSPALGVAAHNCRFHGLQGQLHLLLGDLLAPLPQSVDLIVANLPYVALAEVATLPSEISCYEPPLAWNGGVDGLAVIERLLAQASGYLNTGGSILLEIGATQGSAVQDLAGRRFPTAAVQVIRDGAGLDRVVIVGPAPMTQEQAGKNGRGQSDAGQSVGLGMGSDSSPTAQQVWIEPGTVSQG